MVEGFQDALADGFSCGGGDSPAQGNFIHFFLDFLGIFFVCVFLWYGVVQNFLGGRFGIRMQAQHARDIMAKGGFSGAIDGGDGKRTGGIFFLEGCEDSVEGFYGFGCGDKITRLQNPLGKTHIAGNVQLRGKLVMVNLPKVFPCGGFYFSKAVRPEKNHIFFFE